VQVVERHVISKAHSLWKICDHKAFLSKNLYNLAVFHSRQHYFKRKRALSLRDLYHTVKTSNDYKALPTKVSKQIIRVIATSFNSFVLAEKEYHKAVKAGIKVTLTEESYTSKASALDCDRLPKFADGKKHKFSGHRVHRGLYQSSSGRRLNADTNGSMNIARKVIPDAFEGIEDLPFSPLMVDPLRTQLFTKQTNLG
jgi:transposase